MEKIKFLIKKIGDKLWNDAKKYIPTEIPYYLKIQTYIFQIYGQLTIKKQKVVPSLE